MAMSSTTVIGIFETTVLELTNHQTLILGSRASLSDSPLLRNKVSLLSEH
ncbi:hypothetical protein BH11PSE5_BH11PSE5_26840 [soil metagenome]